MELSLAGRARSRMRRWELWRLCLWGGQAGGPLSSLEHGFPVCFCSGKGTPLLLSPHVYKDLLLLVSFFWFTTSTLEKAQGWQGPALNYVHEDNLP